MMENTGFNSKSKIFKKCLTVFSVIAFLHCVFLLVILGFFLFISFFKPSSHRTVSVDQVSESFHYPSLRINPSKNENSFGISHLISELKNEDYIFYKNDQSGDHFLISNFVDPSFICTGSCYCGTRRSATTTIARKSFYYLLVAATSILAVNIAKNHFNEECKTMLEDTCTSSESIHSKVEKCEEITSMNSETTESSSTQDKAPEKPDFTEISEKERLFVCSGNCIPNSRDDWVLNDPEKMKLINSHKKACYETNLEVIISSKSLVTPCSRNEQIVAIEDTVILEYMQNHLNDEYCQRNTNWVMDGDEKNIIPGVVEFDLCMGPQIFSGNMDKLVEEIVDAKVKCSEIMNLGSLNCEHKDEKQNTE